MGKGTTPACATMDRSAAIIDKRLPSEIRAFPADHDLTVVIPAFNEENRLPWTLHQLSHFLDDWGLDYRVLVADDGSDDETAALTDRLGPRFSTLSLSSHAGKGRAVKTAMLAATGRVLAFTDADLPFDLAAMQRGYDILHNGDAQVVFGARDLAESRYLAPRHWSREIATHVFRAIVKTLISRKVTDTQCGLKLFTHRAAMEIFSRVSIDGFAFDAEVVFLTHRLRLPFERIPVTLVNDYASTLSLRRNALPMLVEVMRIWWRANLAPQRAAPQLVYVQEDLAEISKKAA
jgi:dolichyl-phosphate beta-glucosyltransferase